MKISFLSLPLERTRDVVLARHRARQIARLLGFAPNEQALIAAAAAEIAAEAFGNARGASVVFELVHHALQIHAERAGRLRLKKELPHRREFAVEDAAWIIEQLERERFRPFVEFRRQNQEMLRLLAESPSLRALPSADDEASRKPDAA